MNQVLCDCLSYCMYVTSFAGHCLVMCTQRQQERWEALLVTSRSYPSVFFPNGVFGDEMPQRHGSLYCFGIKTRLRPPNCPPLALWMNSIAEETLGSSSRLTLDEEVARLRPTAKFMTAAMICPTCQPVRLL